MKEIDIEIEIEIEKYSQVYGGKFLLGIIKSGRNVGNCS